MKWFTSKSGRLILASGILAMLIVAGLVGNWVNRSSEELLGRTGPNPWDYEVTVKYLSFSPPLNMATAALDSLDSDASSIVEAYRISERATSWADYCAAYTPESSKLIIFSIGGKYMVGQAGWDAAHAGRIDTPDEVAKKERDFRTRGIYGILIVKSKQMKTAYALESLQFGGRVENAQNQYEWPGNYIYTVVPFGYVADKGWRIDYHQLIEGGTRAYIDGDKPAQAMYFHDRASLESVAGEIKYRFWMEFTMKKPIPYVWHIHVGTPHHIQ